jgi:hypothetical protein
MADPEEADGRDSDMAMMSSPPFFPFRISREMRAPQIKNGIGSLCYHGDGALRK